MIPMWDKLADGVSKQQLYEVVLKNRNDELRISWEHNGLLHLCSLDTLENVKDEDLADCDDFTVWVKK